MVSEESVKPLTEVTLPQLLKVYAPEDVFNVDETGLEASSSDFNHTMHAISFAPYVDLQCPVNGEHSDVHDAHI